MALRVSTFDANDEGMAQRQRQKELTNEIQQQHKQQQLTLQKRLNETANKERNILKYVFIVFVHLLFQFVQLKS